MGDFKPEARAPDTLAKRKMIETGHSRLTAWCNQLRDDPHAVLGKSPYMLYTTAELLRIYDPVDATRTTAQALGRELEKTGFRKVPNDDPDTKVGDLVDERQRPLSKKPVWLIVGSEESEPTSYARSSKGTI